MTPEQRQLVLAARKASDAADRKRRKAYLARQHAGRWVAYTAEQEAAFRVVVLAAIHVIEATGARASTANLMPYLGTRACGRIDRAKQVLRASGEWVPAPRPDTGMPGPKPKPGLNERHRKEIERRIEKVRASKAFQLRQAVLAELAVRRRVAGEEPKVRRLLMGPHYERGM